MVGGSGLLEEMEANAANGSSASLLLLDDDEDDEDLDSSIMDAIVDCDW